MMIQVELWPGRWMISGGDFTDAMFLAGHDSGTHITGLVTESVEGAWGFAFMFMNWGIGMCFRWGEPFIFE